MGLGKIKVDIQSMRPDTRTITRRCVERASERVQREVARRSRQQSAVFHALEHLTPGELRNMRGRPTIMDPPPKNEPSPYDLCGSTKAERARFIRNLCASAVLAAIVVGSIAIWGGTGHVETHIAIYDHQDGTASVQMCIGDRVVHVVTWVNERGDPPQAAMLEARAQAARWNEWRGKPVVITEQVGGKEHAAACRHLPAE